jgi:hypothetical protein
VLALSIALRGHEAWVGREGGIDVFDVADPRKPSQVESIRMRADVEAVAFRGDHVLAAAGSRGLYVLDARDLEHPTVVSRSDEAGRARDLLVVGDVVWVAGHRDGIAVFDLRRPEHPLRVATISTTGEVRELAMSPEGSRVAVAEGAAGVRVLDASRPDAPRVETVVRDAEGALGVAWAGERLVVAAGRRGLLVYPPRRNRLERPAVVPAENDVVAVAVAGRHALAVDRSVGLRVVDLEVDPPREIARAVLPRGASGERIAYRDGIAFLPAGRGPLAIVDVSVPDAPELVHPGKRELRIRFP